MDLRPMNPTDRPPIVALACHADAVPQLRALRDAGALLGVMQPAILGLRRGWPEGRLVEVYDLGRFLEELGGERGRNEA